MNSIPLLIQSLKKNPYSLFKYLGTDWKELIIYGGVVPYQHTLWKSKRTHLLLIGWKPNQTLRYTTTNGIMSSLLVQGNLHHAELPETLDPFVLPYPTFILPPFSKLTLKSNTNCAQLLLLQT